MGNRVMGCCRRRSRGGGCGDHSGGMVGAMDVREGKYRAEESENGMEMF